MATTTRCFYCEIAGNTKHFRIETTTGNVVCGDCSRYNWAIAVRNDFRAGRYVSAEFVSLARRYVRI